MKARFGVRVVFVLVLEEQKVIDLQLAFAFGESAFKKKPYLFKLSPQR